jgi:glutathione S-transferase
VEDATTTLGKAYTLLEKHLRGAAGPWVAGDFSLADCAAAPALFYAGITVPFGAEHPRVAAYFERLLERPSVARTLAEARPYFHFFPLRDRMPARFLGDSAR